LNGVQYQASMTGLLLVERSNELANYLYKVPGKC
jgi:hypothetical protein